MFSLRNLKIQIFWITFQIYKSFDRKIWMHLLQEKLKNSLIFKEDKEIKWMNVIHWFKYKECLIMMCNTYEYVLKSSYSSNKLKKDRKVAENLYNKLIFYDTFYLFDSIEIWHQWWYEHHNYYK